MNLIERWAQSLDLGPVSNNRRFAVTFDQVRLHVVEIYPGQVAIEARICDLPTAATVRDRTIERMLKIALGRARASANHVMRSAREIIDGCLVWDNHGCMPLRPIDTSFLPQLARYRAAGFDHVSLNIGFGAVVTFSSGPGAFAGDSGIDKSSTTVPEPGSAVLLLPAVLILFRRRRRIV